MGTKEKRLLLPIQYLFCLEFDGLLTNNCFMSTWYYFHGCWAGSMLVSLLDSAGGCSCQQLPGQLEQHATARSTPWGTQPLLLVFFFFNKKKSQGWGEILDSYHLIRAAMTQEGCLISKFCWCWSLCKFITDKLRQMEIAQFNGRYCCYHASKVCSW